MEVLYGVHSVEEALKAGRRRFDHVLVARERDDLRIEKLVAALRQAGIRVRQESRDQLTLIAKTPAHQGSCRYRPAPGIPDHRRPVRRAQSVGARACCLHSTA